MRYWIFDQDDSPQRFPLRRLLEQISLVCSTNESRWEVTRADGFGLGINSLDQRLDVAASVTIPNRELLDLVEGIDQWFYNLAATLEGGQVCFGLIDSTMMFVEADADVVAPVVAVFANTRPERSSDLEE